MSSQVKRGQLKVATYQGGESILVGVRRIDNGSNVEKFPVIANDESRLDYGLSNTGTSVTFSRFAKTLPNSEAFDRITKKLGKYYGVAISSGKLSLTLRRNGVEQVVEAEQTPECEDLKVASLEIEGHVFHLEWGVTKDICRDNGCRLIYGGKFFETTAAPCGSFGIGRFYASIRIPRTIGKDSMDILKRTICHDSIDEAFERCLELFRPELEASDAICRKADDAELNTKIESLLSLAVKAPAEDVPPDEGDEPNSSGRMRNYHTRDSNGVGVIPVGSGRKRRGKPKGNPPELPEAIKPYWGNLGADKGLVQYDHDARRITYNLDVPIIKELQQSKNDPLLASIAAGQIARDLEGSDRQKDFGFKDNNFSWMYRTMMERVGAAIFTESPR
jgi:hypothetical protein